MTTIAFAANQFGYCVQVIADGEVIQEYAAGNCQTDSQAFIDPGSPGVVGRSQLRRWAEQTAKEIADEWQIPLNKVEYDPDLEAQLERCETV